MASTFNLPSNLQRAHFSNSLTYNKKTNTIEPLSIGPYIMVNNNQQTPAGGVFGNAYFGVEVGLTQTILNTYSQMGVIKYSVSATGLSQVQNPNWNTVTTGTNSLYENLINSFYTPGITLLNTEFTAPSLDAFIWIQGESDSVQGRTTAEYLSDLTNLINKIRIDTGKPTLPVIIVKLSWRNGVIGNANDLAIRTAQENYVAGDVNSAIIEVDDLTKIDNVHYDHIGIITLGERIANYYLTNFA